MPDLSRLGGSGLQTVQYLTLRPSEDVLTGPSTVITAIMIADSTDRWTPWHPTDDQSSRLRLLGDPLAGCLTVKVATHDAITVRELYRLVQERIKNPAWIPRPGDYALAYTPFMRMGPRSYEARHLSLSNLSAGFLATRGVLRAVEHSILRT